MTRQEKLASRGIEYFFKKKGSSGVAGVIKFVDGRIYFLPRRIVVRAWKNSTSTSCCYQQVMGGGKLHVSFNRSFISEVSFRSMLELAVRHAIERDGSLQMRVNTQEDDFELSLRDVNDILDGFDSSEEMLDWIRERVDPSLLFSDKQIALLLEGEVRGCLNLEIS